MDDIPFCGTGPFPHRFDPHRFVIGSVGTPVVIGGLSLGGLRLR